MLGDSGSVGELTTDGDGWDSSSAGELTTDDTDGDGWGRMGLGFSGVRKERDSENDGGLCGDI